MSKADETSINDLLLDIRNLDVVYNTDDAVIHAVNGISFSLNHQETIGLVGETGAGKTTTALAILRLLEGRIGQIRKGEIFYENRDLLKLSEKEMRGIRGAQISMIFQDPMTSLNPTVSVGDQILESLRIHNRGEKNNAELDMRVDELLQLVGIPATRKIEYPHQFSGGMKQRVVIAIALACQPQLLIADEPTTALDVTIQAQVLAMMEDLKKKLRTSMIMISHDLGVVAETCDKVAIMYAGKIIEQGSVEDIFEHSKHHPYTIGLFDSIPKLDIEEDRLHPIDGLMPDPADLPQGCKFHPRCAHCLDICKEQDPKEIEVEKNHFISCHLFG